MNSAPWNLLGLGISALIFAGYVVAGVTPWYVGRAQDKAAQPVCQINMFYYWSRVVYECSPSCENRLSTALFPCSYNGTNGETNYGKECSADPQNCGFVERLSNLNATIAFLAIAMIFLILAMFAFAVMQFTALWNLFPLKWEVKNFRLAAAFSAGGFLFALFSILTFGIGYPAASQKDIGSSCGAPCTGLQGSESACNVGILGQLGPLNPFSGCEWGGAIGFWLALFLCIANVVLIVFGVLGANTAPTDENPEGGKGGDNAP